MLFCRPALRAALQSLITLILLRWFRTPRPFTFTLPQTLTPSSVNGAGMINRTNVPATFNGGAYTLQQSNQESIERTG